MTAPPRPDAWAPFRERYLGGVPSDPDGLAAYQAFTNLRDASPALWLQEPLKAAYFWTLSRTGNRLDQQPLAPHYDYGFVIDGTSAPGLATSLPVLRALPAGRRALLLVRDHVVRDPRFGELLANPAFAIVNVDRVRSSALAGRKRWRWMRELAREFPSLLASVPKLVLRAAHVEAVLEQVLARTTLSWLVVCNERMILSSAAIHRGRRRGIATACLQHGALVEQYLPVTVDAYLTWGPRANEWFRERSVGARLCDIGCPRADQLSQYLSRGPVARTGPRTVAFFSQPPGTDLPESYTRRVEQDFLSLLQHPEWTLWVRPHPAENPARWEQAAAGSGGRLQVRREGHPYQTIAEADYVGAFYSTVLLEAMLFEKPVFQLNPYPGEAPDYSDREGCAPIRDGASLRQWLARCEADESFRRQALDRQKDYARGCFSNPGRASQAFYECLDSLGAPGKRS